ncbi:MAG: thioredoxin-dependent thiol peroxidase [Acidobacteria bacterium]|nr:thioredoxin-dependent thiol peroxidase [Acidobacteriota bacterium]
MPELKKGDKAPGFTLPGENNKKVSLADYKGKWVIVYFYPKDNTPGCTVEAREFTKSVDDFSQLDAEIIGISADSPESHMKFTNKHDLKLTLLSDQDHKVMEDYGAWGIKKMYGKEYWGIIRSTFLIDPDGKIAEAWYSVKVKGHVEKVKEVLEGLRS